MSQEKNTPQHIVIVGGGFAGIKAALELAKQKNITVTLVADKPDFIYYPTLYHTATGGSDEQSAIPLEDIFANSKARIIIGTAESVDKDQKFITLASRKKISYDQLVLALGVVSNYFNIPGLEENSYGIKSIEDAERLKRHLHGHLLSENQPDKHYIVVGGGPTGIELAGALSWYMRDIMKRHSIKGRVPHIDLVEAMPSLMPRLPKQVGKSIAKRLRKLGIKVYLNSKVEGASADDLTVNGKPLRSHTIIWTAGVANNPFFAKNDFALSPRGKVLVDEFLRAEGSKDIFVLGDNAETPFSGMAQTALYDAEFIAHNVRFVQENRPKLAYRPKEPIYVTPVGPRWASVEWGRWYFDGKLGWLLRNSADIGAFLEIQSPLDAAEQFVTAFDREDLCPVCGFNTEKYPS
jgi:NADH:ubiquinone reductase (H+-translocating)